MLIDLSSICSPAPSSGTATASLPASDGEERSDSSHSVSVGDGAINFGLVEKNLVTSTSVEKTLGTSMGQGHNQPSILRLVPQIKSFASSMDDLLSDSIGVLKQGKDIHFYSFGNFNLVRLVMHLLKQTGPSHLFMTSYSFSQRSIEQLKNRMEQRQLLSFRVIVDNRVRTMSPKPFQMLISSFDYRCLSIHAKVALLWNQDWTISVITSQNATDNPKMERGIIQTDPAVFDFDYKILSEAYDRGTA